MAGRRGPRDASSDALTFFGPPFNHAANKTEVQANADPSLSKWRKLWMMGIRDAKSEATIGKR
jgi:hypothetical protein